MLFRVGYHKGSLLAMAVGVLNLGVLACVLSIPTHTARAQGDKANNNQLEADVHKALDKKKFSNVTASVRDGVVVLSGTVDSYAEKEDADRRIHHVDHVRGVDNQIQVGGGSNISDEALRDKLAKQLSYDRVGYGTTAFNSINIGVKNGVVTLSGTVYGPTDKDSALSLVEHTSGVKDVVDNLEVAPVSPMDDQLRLRLARAIYGDSALQKYAMDPAKPIRITVVNGNVTLSGVVDNKMDHDIAGIRANGVSGVFKVVNDLQIAGEHPGK
jgi:hyperosmotically inducible periplasmic protein